MCCVVPDDAVRSLQSQLARGVKYHVLRDALREALAAAAPSPASFCLRSLRVLASQRCDDDATSPAFHLLLEALACCEPWARPGEGGVPRCEASSAAAAVLLADAVGGRSLDARAVLRLAQTFRLTANDFGDGARSELDAFAARSFDAGLHSPAVLLGLLLSLPSIGTHRLRALVDAKQEMLAESLAEGLGGEHPSSLVALCLAAGSFKAAHRACRRFCLQAVFPEAERLYVSASLARLASRGAWEPAAVLAARSPASRAQLVDLALSAGEAGVASSLAARFGLALDASRLAEAIALSQRDDATTYLQLCVASDNVVWVACLPSLRRAAQALAVQSVVGLDCEWRATGTPNFFADDADGADAEDVPLPPPPPSGRVALLQLATRDAVFLFDLPLLAASCPTELSDALWPSLADPSTLLLGVDVLSDARRCSASYPHVPAFAAACGLLDLRDAWAALAPSRGPHGNGNGDGDGNGNGNGVVNGEGSGSGGNHPSPTLPDKAAGGLAWMARVALGLPLDKRQRCTDWEARPLSAPQLRYAANDAHAAVRIWDALVGGRGGGGAAGVVGHLAVALGGHNGRAIAQIAAPLAAANDQADGDAVATQPDTLGTGAVRAALEATSLEWRACTSPGH